MRITPILLISLAFLQFSYFSNASGKTPVKGWEGPKDKFHIYLLIGDSTMAGTAEITDQDTGIIDRCFLLNKEGKWEPAKAPFNRYSSVIPEDGGAKMGPGYAFVKTMLEKNKDISIGLVVNAAKGSKVEDWFMKSNNYRGARGRTKKAIKSGTLKGVLWHHGGRTLRGWRLDEMKTMITYLRSDLGLLNLPVILGEVPNSPEMNTIVNALSNDVHATGVASAKDLNIKGKVLGVAGVKTFGERYAVEMINLQKELAAKGKQEKKKEIPIIDTHIHANANKENGLDVLAKWMGKNKVERCIVHPLTPTRAKNEDERKIMLANYEKYKGRIYRFCIIEPEEVNSVEEAVKILEKEKAEGAIGFGEHYGRNLMFDDPKNMRLYAACEKVGLPVMFHIDQNKNMDEKGFPHLENALRKYPKCKFIAHAQWWLGLPDGICDRMLREFPNLYADPSGVRMAGMLNRDRKYTKKFLIRNADKVMFGSDAGWWSIKDSNAEELQFPLFEDLDLPDEVKEKIYKSNAEKLFGFGK